MTDKPAPDYGPILDLIASGAVEMQQPDPLAVVCPTCCVPPRVPCNEDPFAPLHKSRYNEAIRQGKWAPFLRRKEPSPSPGQTEAMR